MEKIKPHFLPLAVGIVGLIFLGYGLIVLSAPKKDKPDILFEAAKDESPMARVVEQRIAVDVEGAVQNPGVYKLRADARVQDALIAAGGLSSSADREKVAKTLNLAAKVTDGGKIYIPFTGELSSSGVAAPESSTLGADTSAAININTASLKDLDSLPGIGEVTAQKIISNRPFGSLDELLSKKLVSKKVFESIKDRISVY